jgi:putative oxidoreductase
MPSLFPEIFTYAIFAPTVLRLALAFIFVPAGWQKLKNFNQTRETFALWGFKPAGFWAGVTGLFEFIGGILLFLGLFTQAAAFFIVIIKIVAILKVKLKSSLNYAFDLLIIASGIALILLGPGAFSIDLPL